jgi:hypothetical protein
VPLAEQDRSQWDTELIAEGVAILQAALAQDHLGEYQAQAAIAALHADAPRFEDTDWVQILEWYDELLRSADTPIIRLNRAVAVGEADGAPAGLAALADIDENIPRRDAVAPISTSATATSNSLPASTPPRPTTRPTSQSATTRPARRRGSTNSCVTSNDSGSPREHRGRPRTPGGGRCQGCSASACVARSSGR